MRSDDSLDFDVVVVGAGFAGMYLLHLLRGHGFRTVVLERAGGSPAVERSFFMPTTADVYVAALHRWLNANGGEPFFLFPSPANVVLHLS